MRRKSRSGPEDTGQIEASRNPDSPPRSNAPERIFYKISEVSAITGLEAYVLRYWQTEFPMLRPQKSRGGQRIYQKKDIETILKIKQMLYEKGFTMAGARKVLAARGGETTAAGTPALSGEFMYRLRAELADILRILSTHEKTT